MAVAFLDVLKEGHPFWRTPNYGPGITFDMGDTSHAEDRIFHRRDTLGHGEWGFYTIWLPGSYAALTTCWPYQHPDPDRRVYTCKNGRSYLRYDKASTAFNLNCVLPGPGGRYFAKEDMYTPWLRNHTRMRA